MQVSKLLPNENEKEKLRLKEEMEGRKWEELPMDCLVDILGRVGVGSLLVDVPFVCKSWYKATLNPLCWKELDFPDISSYLCLSGLPFIIRFSIQYGLWGEICTTKFLKVVVDRSAGYATMVKLPPCYTEEALTYVAEKCPALKKLVLHSEKSSSMSVLSFVIGKFKNLESLEIKSSFLFKDIVTKIGAHCANFVALSLVKVSDAFSSAVDALSFAAESKREEEIMAICLSKIKREVYIGEEEVMAIVTCLPKIKCLALRGISIKRENLIKLLKGCVGLVHLDVRLYRGFDEDDDELLKLASSIRTFKCSGSVFDHAFCDDDNHYDYYSSD